MQYKMFLHLETSTQAGVEYFCRICKYSSERLISDSRTCDNFGKYTVSDISPLSWTENIYKLMCHFTEFFLDICTHFLNSTHNIIGDKLTHSNSYTEHGHFSSAAITIISLVKSPSVSMLYQELFYNLDEQKIPSLIVSRSALSFN